LNLNIFNFVFLSALFKTCLQSSNSNLFIPYVSSAYPLF
jgi:hypothetical protein